MRRENAILLICSLGFCLLLGEIIIRLAGVAPDVAYIEKWRMRLAKNPKIGFEPIPNLDTTGRSIRYFGYPGKSNSLGFRGKEPSLKKLPGERKVLVLGDSIVAGLWIAKDHQTLPVLLESRLNQSFLAAQSVAVMNFGVLGYNTQQEVETLIDKGLSYDPDLVILSYCLNDRLQNDGGVYYHLLEEEKTQRALNTLTLTPVSRMSAFFRWLRFVVLPSWGLISEQPRSRSPRDLGQDTVEQYLKRFSDLSKQHGFRALVIMFPDFRFVDKQISAYEDEAEHKRISEIAKDNGLLFLDLLPSFLKCKENFPGELQSFDRYHPRPLGNRCAAESVARFIEDRGLLK